MQANGKTKSSFGSAAYGGDNWSQRNASHAGEVGHIWISCGMEQAR